MSILAERRPAAPDRAFRHGVRAAGLASRPGTDAPVTEADLAALPAAAQRYLRAMGVVGRQRDWSFRAHLRGRFRRRRGERWMRCEAWQYNCAIEVARLFRMRLMFAGVLPMTGWDTYRHGRGRMRGKLLGLATVADGAGPEFDISELVTWLNDAVLLAPSMLLRPGVRWAAGADDDSFTVAMTDARHRVQADVFLDEAGLPRDFSTHDRFADLPGGLVRARWSTPVAGWSTADGRPLPAAAAAVWHLDDGPFRYGELAVDDFHADVGPDDR